MSAILTRWKGIPAHALVAAGAYVDAGLVHLAYRLQDGRQHNVRIFPLRGGNPWWLERGKAVVMFGLETLPRLATPLGRARAARAAIIVCEGESDCLMVRCAFAEALGAVSHYYVLGLPGAGTWRSSWAHYLEPFGRVYLLPDGDEPGRRMAATIRRDAPWTRTVWLPPGSDARSILQGQGMRALDWYFDRADWIATEHAAYKLTGDVDQFETLMCEKIAVDRDRFQRFKREKALSFAA